MEVEVGVEWLLRAGWIAATLPILLAFFPAGSIRRLLCSLANRGKTLSPLAKVAPFPTLHRPRQEPTKDPVSSCVAQRFLVPQSFFLHFYVVGLLWTSLLLLCIWCHALGKEPGGGVWRAVFTLLLMEVQVLRRLYESVFVFHYSSSAKMHAVGYLTGLCFYIAAPLSIFHSAHPESWHYMRSFSAGRCPTGLSWPNYVKPLLKLGWFQWIGAATFIWGSVHQFHCHSILGSVRRRLRAGTYVIVNGGWFELVSCPHYLAEIIIYAGLLVSSGGLDLTMWLLFAFVVINLAFAAVETHKWYLREFESYPSSRCAILPWIF